MILDTPYKNLTISLGEPEANAAVVLRVVCSVDYMDYFVGNNAAIPGSQQSRSNGNANVVILSSPVTNVIRKATSVTAHNEDSIPHSVAISLNDATIASQFAQFDAILQTDDCTTYADATGWVTADSNGARKYSQNYVGNINLTGDVTGFGSLNGSVPTTLANVNTNIGLFGNNITIPQITVNQKGLVTSISNVAMYVPSGNITLTGVIYGSGTTGNVVQTFATLQTGTGNTFAMQNGANLVAPNIGFAIANSINSGNLITSNGVYWTANGASYLSDLYSNIGAYETYANGQISSLTTHINTLDANVGLFEINANANITAINSHLITLDANVGLFEINANANITAINSHLITLDANVGAYENAVNSSFNTMNSHLTTLDANVGGNEVWANVQFNSINSSITAANAHIATLDANVGAFETYANSQIIAFYTNANAASYLTTYTGNISVSNLVVTTSLVVGNVTPAINGITSQGNITTLRSIVSSGASISGNVSVGNATITNTFTTANLITTNGVFWANGTQYITLYGNAQVAAYLPVYTGNISANVITSVGSTCWTLPSGANSARPGFATYGSIRFNTDIQNPEWYNPTTTLWVPFGGNITGGGFSSFTMPYLIVAGGGGGPATPGGGGGAGGMITGNISVTSAGTVYTITVGAGGTGAPGPGSAYGTSGANSSITGQTIALGGGAGGPDVGPNGYAGGSGGGGSYNNGAGGSGTTGQGYAGGSVSGVVSPYASAGGGGAGAVGVNGSGSASGAGGIGANSSITGTSVTYAGGGGGGGTTQGATLGQGGLGGGGNGGGPGQAVAGTVNLGGGGGGGSNYTGNFNGANGGSGVVILSVPSVSYSGTTTGAPTVTTSGLNTILTYTASGSYTS